MAISFLFGRSDAAHLAIELGSLRAGERLVDIGVEIVASSPAELAAQITTEIERWAKVVKEARITPE